MEDLAGDIGSRALNLAKMGVRDAVRIALAENSELGQSIGDTLNRVSEGVRSMEDYLSIAQSAKSTYEAANIGTDTKQIVKAGMDLGER